MIMARASNKTNPARELVFGDLWEYDAAPETADVRSAFAGDEYQPGPDMLQGAHV